MLLCYDAVLQLQKNIALDVSFHSTKGSYQTQKYICHYAFNTPQNRISPKAIVKNSPSLRLFHWLLRIPYFNPNNASRRVIIKGASIKSRRRILLSISSRQYTRVINQKLVYRHQISRLILVARYNAFLFRDNSSFLGYNLSFL